MWGGGGRGCTRKDLQQQEQELPIASATSSSGCMKSVGVSVGCTRKDLQQQEQELSMRSNKFQQVYENHVGG